MVKLVSYLSGSKKRITSVKNLEGALTYYVVSRLRSLFFSKGGTNYEIEICSCDELSVSNLFHSKVIHFGGVHGDEEVRKFLCTVVLREGQQNVSSNKKEDTSPEEQPQLSKNSGRTSENCSRWNVFILKILFLLYKYGRGKEKKYFGEFASYVTSLFHRENGIIKRKDKLFFLILFFFLITKTDPWKGRRRKRHVGGRCSQFATKAARRKKKKKNCDHYKNFYEQLRRRRCDEFRLRAAHKFLRTGLCHVHLIQEGANAQLHSGEEKKTVLILCKKSLRYLSEVCAKWKSSQNCLSNDNCLNCLNRSGEFAGEGKNFSVKEKHERLKNASLWKLMHKMKHRKACGWGSTIGKRKRADLDTSMEGRVEEEGIPGEEKPNPDRLFTVTCVCIYLLCNTNCYNHYYRLMSLLREIRTFHLHERVNHFVNELAKVDPKCQHVWNMKNALLYMYVEMCLKRSHLVVKQKKNKKDAHVYSNEEILKYVKDNFRFFVNILELKSYNYMATSHICKFNQLIGFLCMRKKNGPCESTSLRRTMEKRFYTIVKKNAYYYAMHNSFLLVHLQDMYLSLVECLRDSYYCVAVRTNLFTYSFDLVRGHELCSDDRWEMAKGGWVVVGSPRYGSNRCGYERANSKGVHTSNNRRRDGRHDGGEGPLQAMSNTMEEITYREEVHMGYPP
ncbi:hypothetical protein AK88_05139, partial [Plasmodium fragile]